jgi:hypothetical protein
MKKMLRRTMSKALLKWKYVESVWPWVQTEGVFELTKVTEFVVVESNLLKTRWARLILCMEKLGKLLRIRNANI